MGQQDYQPGKSQELNLSPKPFVSVCIPARNSEACIGYVIENLLDQECPWDRFEIVIANHASADSTAAIVDGYVSRHRNIRLIAVDDAAKSRAHVRNRCLEAARGEIVVFIDSDILVCNTFIEGHLRAHEEHSNSLVAGYMYGKMQVFGGEGGADRGLRTPSITDRYKTLQSSPLYKDSREFYACIDREGADYQRITDRPDAWRACWSCNLSARRQDFLEIGGFDENFTGWGLEDEELGYRFLQSGRDLVFAKRAWGYHLPHAANVRRNYSEFRRNLIRFFNRHQTADIELLHINHFPSALKGILGSGSGFFPDNTEYALLIQRVAARLPPSQGSRLGVFMRQEADAGELDLTHCFLPGLPWNTGPYQKVLAGKLRRFYSLLGLHTPFDKAEITETLLPVDSLMFLNESLLSGILLEAGRISRKLILVQGAIASNPDNAEARGGFERLLSMVRTEAVTVLNV